MNHPFSRRIKRNFWMRTIFRPKSGIWLLERGRNFWRVCSLKGLLILIMEADEKTEKPFKRKVFTPLRLTALNGRTPGIRESTHAHTLNVCSIVDNTEFTIIRVNRFNWETGSKGLINVDEICQSREDNAGKRGLETMEVAEIKHQGKHFAVFPSNLWLDFITRFAGTGLRCLENPEPSLNENLVINLPPP